MARARRNRIEAAARLVLGMLALLTTVPHSVAAEAFEIVVIGDSIAKGQTGEPAGPRYGVELRAALPAATGAPVVIQNVACGGSRSIDWTLEPPTTRCGVFQLEAPIFEELARPRLPADVALLAVGGADAAPWLPEPRSAAEYAESMMQVLGQLEDAGASRLVWMISPRLGPDSCRLFNRFGGPFRLGNARLASYRDIALDLCESSDHVSCVDLFALLTDDDLGQGCDPHPNAQGQRKIADALLPVLVDAYLQTHPVVIDVDVQPLRARNVVRLLGASGNRTRWLPVALYATADAPLVGELDLSTLQVEVGDAAGTLAALPWPWEADVDPCIPVDLDRDGQLDYVCWFALSGLRELGRGRHPVGVRARTRSGAYVVGEDFVHLKIGRRRPISCRGLRARDARCSAIPSPGP